MKSVSGGARCLWRAGFEKEKSFEIGRKNDGMMNERVVIVR